MAWTYVTTTDWRISEQTKRLNETAQLYLSDDPRKAENVPCTLALLFGIKSNEICAQKAQTRCYFELYLNFVKKFQFPNPKPRNYKDTIEDGILIAPLREIVKVLFYLKKNYADNNVFLSLEEICYLILHNPKVAKNNGIIDYNDLLTEIIKYRTTNKLPEFIAPEEDINNDWKCMSSGRCLKELIQILSFLDFIDLDEKTIVRFKNYSLFEQYIQNIVNYNSYFVFNDSWDRTTAENKYLSYLNENFSVVSNNVIYEQYSEMLTPEWFLEQAKNYNQIDIQSQKCREEFIEKFGIEKLKTLSGEELLNTMFLNGSDSNLCYVLEYNNQYRALFGSIKGGNAYKYGLFYNGDWYTGTRYNPKKLTIEEAVLLGEEIRDNIIKGAKILEANKNVSTSSDYKNIYDQLFDIQYLDKIWVLKYYQMLYPELLPIFYNDEWVCKIADLLDIQKTSNKFVNMGEISLFIRQCGISNVVFAHICYDLLNNNINQKTDNFNDESFETGIQTDFDRNRILFGAPGTGKSFILNKEIHELLKDGGEYERVTFHPDYSYANFVGTYKPIPSKDSQNNECITYEYVPGPFIRMYVKAMKNKGVGIPKPYILVIEEINRANVAAVFGDVFQLLDRNDKGSSEYSIQASEDLKKYLSKELGGNSDEYDVIKMPDNMFIWATMNSADQGVYPLDTAFKRRWDFKYIGIDENEETMKDKVVELGKDEYKKKILWNDLRKAINNYLSNDLKINEDKLMGPYFLSNKVISGSNEEFITAFKNKVIMYLFDDAAKQKRTSLFSSDIDCTRYSAICDAFDKKGINIFCSDISLKIKDVSEQTEASE